MQYGSDDDQDLNKRALMDQLQQQEQAPFEAPPLIPPANGNTGITGGLGTIETRDTMAPAVPPAAAPQFGQIQGYDFGKLSGAKPYDSGVKYSDMVRNFSQYLGGGGKVGRNDLGGAVEYAKAHGFGGAKAVGDDKIDYGDGTGGHDVINSKGEVWFETNEPGGGQQAPGGPAPMQAGSLSPMLQGDPSAGIQQALSAFTGKSPNIQALLQQLAQG